MHLCLEDVLGGIGLYLHGATPEGAPFLLQRMFPINNVSAHCTFIGSAFTVGCRRREVVLLGVFAHGAICGKARCQARHAIPHARHPSGGDTVPVAGIKLGNHFPFEQVVERFGFGPVPSRIVAMFPAVPQRGV